MSVLFDKIIGVDPGISAGCICEWTEKTKFITHKMPREEKEIGNLFASLKENCSDPIVFIEKVNTWRTDAMTAGKQFGIDKMNKNYSQIIALITFLKIPYVEVPSVKWQKLVLSMYSYRNTPLLNKNKKHIYRMVAESFTGKRQYLWQADGICISAYGQSKLNGASALYLYENVKNYDKEKFISTFN